MKIITLKDIAPLFVIGCMIIAGVVLMMSPCVADKLPTHWNVAGEIDGWSSKTFVALFYPLLALGLWILMIVLPYFDPFRRNYEKFATPYFYLRLILVLFMAGIFGFTVATAFGYQLDIKLFMVPALGLMFVGIGVILPRIKKNWFAGIRTPWTLQSDEVWTRTHQFAGKTFMIAGVVSMASIFFGDLAFYIFIGIVLLGAISPTVYSYVVYKKLGLFKKIAHDH